MYPASNYNQNSSRMSDVDPYSAALVLLLRITGLTVINELSLVERFLIMQSSTSATSQNIRL